MEDEEEDIVPVKPEPVKAPEVTKPVVQELDPTGLLPGGTGTRPVAPITISEANNLGEEPASKTVRLDNEANSLPEDQQRWWRPDSNAIFGDSVRRSFRSGDNWGYQLYKRLEREAVSPPPDPAYDPADFIKRNRDVIPGTLEMQFKLAESEGEANLILRDMQSELADKAILARRGGFSTFVAAGLAGIVDIDTPLSMISGGLATGLKGGVLATKWGRMAGSGLAGGLTNVAGETVSVNAGTTGDWTSIPAAGLGGMMFGMAGGVLAKNKTELRANAAVVKTIRDFDEYVAEGAPLAARDNREIAHAAEDPFGSVKLETQTRAIREAEKAAEEKHAKLDEKEALAQVIEDANDRQKIDAEAKASVDAIIGKDQPPSPGKDPSNGAARPQVFDPTDPNVVLTEYTPGMTSKDIQGDDTGSMGARAMPTNGSIANVPSQRSQDMINDATAWAQRTGILDEIRQKYTAIRDKIPGGDMVSKAAIRMHDFLEATPLTNDFNRAVRSGSVVGARLVYEIFENSSGVVRNNQTAANLQDMYNKRLGDAFHPAYSEALQMYAKETGIGRFAIHNDTKALDAFNTAVALELNARAYQPGVYRAPPASVVHAANAWDRFTALEIEIGRGMQGEHSIKGYEFLQSYSGYLGQKWKGAKIQKLIESGRSSKDIIDAVSEAYRDKHKGMTKDQSDRYAKAAVQRAQANDRGSDVNLIGILQQDGRQFLEEVLERNNIPQKEVDDLIDSLTAQAATRGQAAHTKTRLDIDMRFQASNGIRIVDLMDVDLPRLAARRARGTAGAAALARKGIRSKTDIQDIIDTIIHEQQARGSNTASGTSLGDKFNDFIDKDRPLTREEWQDMFSYFGSGPIAGGVSPMWSNVKKLTNLALLNQLGLIQMAELGPQIAAVGLKRFYEHAGHALRGQAMDPKSELVKEMRHMGVLVPEEKAFRDDLNVEMDRDGPASSELAANFQRYLNMGQRIQGYTSGFYAIRNFQQRVSVTSAIDKVMQNMSGRSTDLSAARAADLGLDEKLYNRIQKRYANPPVGQKKRKTSIVDFDPNGSVIRLNLHKWEPEDAQAFAAAMNRHVNQVVQKAMAGESTALFHKDGVASLFFHLKSFPLLAMEKQFGRNMRLADVETTMTFLAGLATAATAYTVKQAINGSTQNLNLEAISRGAFGYSNMTGWLPMWSDPLAAMLGMDSLRFNAYTRPGQAGGVLSVPPALSTLERMAHLPAIPWNAVTGDLSNNDVRALQATPIIGNAYGFALMFNALKQ